MSNSLLSSVTAFPRVAEPVPVHTVVFVDCANCHAEMLVDVVMMDTGARPPRATVDFLLVGRADQTVECDRCGYASTRDELERQSELATAIQDHALVVFRGASRNG